MTVRKPYDPDNVTAVNHPTLRRDILASLRKTTRTYPLGTCDEVTAKLLHIPTEWVYAVRSRGPLPEEPVPEEYTTIYLANKARPGRPAGHSRRTTIDIIREVFATTPEPTQRPRIGSPPLATYTRVTALLATRPLSCIPLIAGVPPATVNSIRNNTFAIRQRH